MLGMRLMPACFFQVANKVGGFVNRLMWLTCRMSDCAFFLDARKQGWEFV